MPVQKQLSARLVALAFSLLVTACGGGGGGSSAGTVSTPTTSTTPVTPAAPTTTTPTTYKVSFIADGGGVKNLEGTTDITASGTTVAPGASLDVLLVPDLAHAGAGNQASVSGACTGTGIGRTMFRITVTGDCQVSVKYFKIDSDHNGVADADETSLHLQWVDVQPHVVRSADVANKKATITFTAYLTGNMGVKGDGSLAKAASVKLRTNFTGVGTSVLPGVEEVVLYDDGTHGDEIAGDGIYSAKFTPSGVVASAIMSQDASKATITYNGKVTEVNNLLAFYDESGAKLTPANASSVVGQGSLVMVLDDAVPEVAVSKVADNMYKSGRFLVLVDPSYTRHDDSMWAGLMASRYVSGQFDFFTKWNLGRSFGMNWSWFSHVRRFADGIGLDATASNEKITTDSSASYGLPGICGVIDMGSIHLAGHGFNHEVNHCWSAYYDKPEMKLAHGDGHWSAASVVLGPVTTSPSLTSVGSLWMVQWTPIFPSNRVMSMLDLYNAGLAGISEVPSMYYVDETSYNAAQHVGELVPSQYIHQMTGADLVRIYGTRSAGYGGIKNFRMLTLVIDSAPLTEAEAAYMELMLAHIAGTSDGDPVNNTLAPSFAKVCQGRCTFSTDIK